MKKRINKIIRFIGKMVLLLGTLISLVLTGVSMTLYFSINWMFDTWSNLSINELLYHLTAPMDGTNIDVITDYMNTCVAPTVVIVLMLLIIYLGFRKTKKYFIIMIFSVFVSVGCGVFNFYEAWEQLDASSYVKKQDGNKDFIEQYYVDPRSIEIVFPEKKRNLIYIFLESMEVTYADKENGGGFDCNLIPELTQIAKENEDFSGEDIGLNGGNSLNGSTWTMGALFSQTAGIPLNISIDRNSMDTQESFFDSIITLGDILEDAGYSQTFMIGSDAKFGGRELYFTKHGNFDILDYKYAKEMRWIPEDYKVWWGYEDVKLFEFAKQKLLDLAEQEEPFNFTMLTVDTHFEDGWTCDECPSSYGENVYANVMACSSIQVAKFLRWIQAQDFYENTTVVICGDHPTMDSDFCDNVEKEYNRKVYTAFINSAVQKKQMQSRTYATFDLFPTTLAALGVEISGERLGLGTNLYSDRPTRTEEIGLDDENRELAKKSEFLLELAKLDEEDEILLIREGKSPKTKLIAEPYDYNTGYIHVTASEIKNIQLDEIASVQLAVWTLEDQSDLQWVGMYSQGDGSYYGDIDVSGFSYKPGKYHIQAYIFDLNGKSYLSGGANGYVQ